MVTLIETIEGVRRACDDARAAGRTVGLVPTMGYLHEGHRSLMRRARAETDLVVVSIFVNPTQFGPNEDLARYPRDLPGDLDACRAEGVDVVFAPSVEEMYPNGAATTVHVEGVTRGLCGDHRPGHFDGVTTVVAKLFAITGRSRAYFGRKDAQQVAVVARMAADLDLPVEVVACPLVRETDGLARSSRNAYLAPDDRRAAPVLFNGLRAAAELVAAGERDPQRVIAAVRDVVATEPRVELEYVEARDAATMAPIDRLDGDVLLALAAHLGATRLIDNVGIAVRGDAVEVDLGTTPAPSLGSS
ncbi:MAG TPA: pantoate--beta-alanine ligase [Acidimicrobiia bacterium]|jgi:pantoate--beta-alanine ligase|nr:pantoate--beta-alanine ligase [Acidimicrobiia bacterium]